MMTVVFNLDTSTLLCAVGVPTCSRAVSKRLAPSGTFGSRQSEANTLVMHWRLLCSSSLCC